MCLVWREKLTTMEGQADYYDGGAEAFLAMCDLLRNRGHGATAEKWAATFILHGMTVLEVEKRLNELSMSPDPTFGWWW